MKRDVRKIYKEIEVLSKNSDLSEYQIMEELLDFYKKRRRTNIVKLYAKNKNLVTNICKKYNISTKTLYKILGEDKVKANRKYTEEPENNKME